jgi:hypothetical protein
MSERVNDTTLLVHAARPSRGTRATEVFAALLIFLSPALVAGAFLGDFLDRDRASLQANPVTKDLGAGLQAIFRPSAAGDNTANGWFAPLEQLRTGLQFRLVGPVAWSFRLVNLLMHIATAWFLYRIVLGLLPRGTPLSAAEESVNADAAFNSGRHVVAAFGALFFFLHPVNVESMACVPQRGCTQASFFGVLAWWLMVRRGSDRKNWRRLAASSWSGYSLSLLCLVVAVLSHPMACAIAGVLALTQYVWVREGAASRWLKTAGFVIVGAAFAALSAQSGLWVWSANDSPLSALALLGRLLLGLLVPTTLSGSYVFVPPAGPEDPAIWIAVGLMLAAVFLHAWLPMGVRPTCTLLPSFLLMLLPWALPGAGRDAVGHQGLCLALPVAGVVFGLGVEAMQYRLRFMGKEGGKVCEAVGVGLAVLFFLLLGALSVSRSFAFSDDTALRLDVGAANAQFSETDAGTSLAP